MKNVYFALAIIGVMCMTGECENFSIWLIWEAFWIAVTLLSIRNYDKVTK